MSTADDIREVCGKLQQLLLEKNEAYGDSIFDPVHVFSNLTPAESIRARLDDKISRWKKGKAAGEDTEWDMAGYSALLLVAQLQEQRKASDRYLPGVIPPDGLVDTSGLGITRLDPRGLTPNVSDPATWQAFCEQVHDECLADRGVRHKMDLIAFASYEKRMNPATGDVSITMASVIALDLEVVNFDDAHQTLVDLGADALFHGTPSDVGTGAHRRLRVYVRLDRRYDSKYAGLARERLARLLGVRIDRSDLAANRAYLCGRLEGTPVRLYSRVQTDRAVDATVLLSQGEWVVR